MSGAQQLLATYLDRLPGGVAAHPQCMVKASIVRHALASRALGADVPLPEAIRALVEAPPPASVWVPEVHFNCVQLAIRGAYFDGDDDGFLRWVYDQNRKLLGTALYRVLFFVVSPERLLPGLEKRWGSFRRGTHAKVVQRGPKEAELHVTAPPYLYTPLTVQAMAVALRAAITCAGAVDAMVEGSVLSSTEVVYRARWR